MDFTLLRVLYERLEPSCFMVTNISVCVTRVEGGGLRRQLGRCPSFRCSDVLGSRRAAALLRRTIVNRTYGTHKNIYQVYIILLFLVPIFGPIYNGPPEYTAGAVWGFP